MGHFPIVANGIYVHNSATIIGHVNLGENVSVWPGAVIRGDINFIKIAFLGRHSHGHTHEALSHSHAHYPDSHHRHEH